MAKHIVKKVGEAEAEPTKDEMLALLEAYKQKNPEKYATKLANGEFEKYGVKS